MSSRGGPGRGQGRKALLPDRKMVARLIDLPQSMWNDLDTIAEHFEKPRNAYIRSILQHAIDLDLPALQEQE